MSANCYSSAQPIPGLRPWTPLGDPLGYSPQVKIAVAAIVHCVGPWEYAPHFISASVILL